VGLCRSAGLPSGSLGAGWALVGDAGYFKDPLTAHGMTDALRDAELLAVAAARGSEITFAAYAALREELSRAFFDATDAIASFAWNLDTVRRLKLETEHLARLREPLEESRHDQEEAA
jgi:menaquinone-9 beta-reductase